MCLPSALIVGGDDKGIELLRYDRGRFLPEESVPGYNASSQYMAMDNNSTVWVAHSYLGVYRIDLNDTLHPRIKLYTRKEWPPFQFEEPSFQDQESYRDNDRKGRL